MEFEARVQSKNRNGMNIKGLWLGLGFFIFAVISFVVPVSETMIQVSKEYGFAKAFTDAGIASDPYQAAWKMKMVVGIIPMVVIYFATEAMPIGLVGLLMPTLAYFFGLLPQRTIAKTFAGDESMFLLGVLAMGVTVIEVGLHNRLASWVLGWTRGFIAPIVVLCLSMAMLGSFISAHAMAAFMTPVMVAVYFGSVAARSKGDSIEHDPLLAKMLLFAMCYSLNVGGVGSPAAGGRNVIMMGFFSDYNVPMTFGTWMKYGFPLVPALGLTVAIYMLVVFRKVKTKNLSPGLQMIKEETRRVGKITYGEFIGLGLLVLVLVLWVFQSETLGLGGPALLALFIPVLFGVVDWRKILMGISWDAWFMYCGALTLGALLKETGGAIWLAQTFLGVLKDVGADHGLGLWIGMSTFTALITNFMSDAGSTALIGPIAVPMGIMSGHSGEPWAVGLAVAWSTSFAHFLVVGTANNAIVYGLGMYPDSEEKILRPFDFVKYGFVLWILSLVVTWVLGFIVIYNLVGFPAHIIETAAGML